MAYYTRSRARQEYKAAGVLPFSLHEGSVLVLLGGEPCKTGPGGKVWRIMWRDFGGGREAVDAGSEATAAREFAEETLGLFSTCGVDQRSVELAAAAMEARLHAPGLAIRVVHALKRGSFHFYVTQQPFVAPLMFRLASQQNDATGAVAGAEKTAFAWVPLRALLECVAVSAPRYFLETRAHVCGGPGTPPAQRCGRRRFRLHPCFASSVRMAQQRGLEQLISQARELPLPPPPPLLHPPPVLADAPQTIEPAASVQGGTEVSGTGMTVDSVATAAEVPECGAEGCSSEEGPDSSCRQESLVHWLAREEVVAALRASDVAPVCSAGAAERGAASGCAAAASASASQQQLVQAQQSPHAAWSGQGAPAGAAPASAPAPSGSSLAPASSMDTASSLRASREAVAAAAVEQVVQQIEANSRRKGQQRLSRKQRQKRRRQRLKAEQQRLAQEVAPADKGGVGDSPAADPPSACTAGHSMPQCPLSPGSACTSQRRPHQQDAEAPGAADTSGPAAVDQSTPAASPPPPPPPHWRQAAADLEAAFQPHMRLRKRVRLAVGPEG